MDNDATTETAVVEILVDPKLVEEYQRISTSLGIDVQQLYQQALEHYKDFHTTDLVNFVKSSGEELWKTKR